MEAVLQIDEDAEYSIWISFCEVYNEQIYDLLEEPPSLLEENKGIKRTILKIKVPLLSYYPFLTFSFSFLVDIQTHGFILCYFFFFFFFC